MSNTLADLAFAGKRVRPPLLLAPMAGVTHSAFRRLVADFGGHGALFTEMLSAAALGTEDVSASPFTKRRTEEGAVIYQLQLHCREEVARCVEKLCPLEPFGLDINCACPAPEIRARGGGIELFNNRETLQSVLAAVRAAWNGPLSVKCRLGSPGPQWQETFADRLSLFAEAGVDAVIVHPRFSDEKLKRTARWELFSWIAANTALPLIASGDIIAPTPRALGLLAPGPCAGLMIGRIAAVKPWIFREFAGEQPAVDYREVWSRFYEYVLQDFRPERAIGRLKEFTAYFSRNFIFGHELFRRVQSATDPVALKKAAVEFLSSSPAVTQEPSVRGI